MSPYLKLLPMLAGIGSPGTIQEVTGLHILLMTWQHYYSRFRPVTQLLVCVLAQSKLGHLK